MLSKAKHLAGRKTQTLTLHFALEQMLRFAQHDKQGVEEELSLNFDRYQKSFAGVQKSRFCCRTRLIFEGIAEVVVEKIAEV